MQWHGINWKWTSHDSNDEQWHSNKICIPQPILITCQEQWVASAVPVLAACSCCFTGGCLIVSGLNVLGLNTSLSACDAATGDFSRSVRRWHLCAVLTRWHIKSARLQLISGRFWCVADTAVFLTIFSVICSPSPVFFHISAVALQIIDC